MKELKCAICGDGADAKILYEASFDYGTIDEKTFSARRLPEKCHYRILRCNGCGLVYSSPILDPREIERLYKKSGFVYGNEVENIKETYGRCLKGALPEVPPAGNLLEIGCGNGFFLEKALELGFKNVYGVEPSKIAVENADAKVKGAIVNDIFRPGMFKKDFFDVVCFFQTIDHLIDPNEFLQVCRGVLKPGGITLCISHNTGAFSTKAMGEASPIFDIGHIYLFDKSTMKKIFEKNGFRVIGVIDVTNTYSLGYWTSLLPLPLAVKRIILKGLEFSGLGRIKLPLSGGNIGIIASK